MKKVLIVLASAVLVLTLVFTVKLFPVFWGFYSGKAGWKDGTVTKKAVDVCGVVHFCYTYIIEPNKREKVMFAVFSRLAVSDVVYNDSTGELLVEFRNDKPIPILHNEGEQYWITSSKEVHRLGSRFTGGELSRINEEMTGKNSDVTSIDDIQKLLAVSERSHDNNRK